MLPEYVTKVFHKIAGDLNFVDYEISTKAGSKHGDNFLGVIIAVTLSGTRDINGERVSDDVHLLVKLPPDNKKRRLQFQSDMVFDRELLIYSKVLPVFAAFQREKGLSDDEMFLAYPKIYACEFDAENDSHILVMENLRMRNFDMWPKKQTVRYDHELLVMETLGKFHGISFALKDQRPDAFEEFKKLDDILSKLMIDSFLEETSERATNSIKNVAHKELYSVQRFKNGLFKPMIWEARNKFGVISHGDCWNNNYMFQYGDENRNDLKAVAMIDLQLSRYCSPALDIIYRIFSGTDKDFRDKHYEQLLKAYHASLSGMIRRLGSDPEKLFTFNDLLDELRASGEFALVVAPMIGQVRLVDSADVVNMDNYAIAIDSGEYVPFVQKFDDKTQAAFDDLMTGVVNDLLDYGYVQLQQN